ncbi:MAG: hypothetical protein V2B15_05895 [Bacteroidota bacterium]
MENFVKKVLEGDGVVPSEGCVNSFHQNFEDAVNIEWFKRDNKFEAVFYKNNVEHIAIFSLHGIFMEYRINMPADYLPGPIKRTALSRGEIMSSVMRNKGNMVDYEVIVRDKELNRHLVTLSDMGRIIEDKRL